VLNRGDWGANLSRKSGEGVADSGGFGIGPLGAGFGGGNELVLNLTVLLDRGLATIRPGDPESTECTSDPVAVAKELVADAAERGIVSSAESSEFLRRSLRHEARDFSSGSLDGDDGPT
jgi:hypothetical protein